MNDGQRIVKRLSHDSSSGRVSVIMPGAFFSRLPGEIIEGGGFISSELHEDPQMLADLACYIKDTLATVSLSLPFLLTVESHAYGGEVEPRQSGGPLDTCGYDFPLKSVGESMKILNPLSDGRLPMVVETVAVLRSRQPSSPIIADVGAPLAILSSLLDTAEILKAFIRDKEALHTLLAHITDNTISYARALVEAGADIICVMDNFSTPGIVGEFFREFSVPYINRVTDAIREAGASAIVHICGELERFGEDINKLSAEALSLDAAASVERVKSLTVDKVLAAGASHRALCGGEPGDLLIEEVRRMIKGGADMIAPSCGLDGKVEVGRLKDITSCCSEMESDGRTII